MGDQSKQFEILDLIPGEAAFRAYGSTLSELFSNGALALFSVMVDIKMVEPKKELTVDLVNPSVDRLFIDFLSELVYLKDAHAIVFSLFDVTINKQQNYHLHATVHGEPINSEKHKLGVDVKGVTLHMYKFEQLSDGFRAQVVLDI